jgi:hypothetical protein
MKLKASWIILMMIVLAACSSAPVQEMSDARQALNAAERAGAQRHSPVVYSEAKRFLSAATVALKNGEYSQAKSSALKAKKRALRARELSMNAPLLQ